MRVEQLAGWIPIRVHWQNGAPVIDWCYLGTHRFTDPFFDQTISRCMRHPFSQLFRHQTPIEILGEWQQIQPGLSPTGFIFHMSRCGSTLISQVLASLPQNVVISEASPIDSILRANFRSSEITDEMRVSWLQWIVSALGQKRGGQEDRLFIKFDSWSILDLNVIKQAFPDVPWVFVYREPVEVMVSQLRHRGAHMVPGVIEPQLFGLETSALAHMPPEEYCARILSIICQAALEHPSRVFAMFINYLQLPEVIWSSVLDFFQVSYTNADINRMKYVAQFDAKNPLLTFEEDSASKKSAASDLIKQMAKQWVAPIYEKLELTAQP